jgi:hypothetical protein
MHSSHFRRLRIVRKGRFSCPLLNGSTGLQNKPILKEASYLAIASNISYAGIWIALEIIAL